MNVLHLPVEIAGNMRRMAKCLNGVGIHSESWNFSPNWMKFHNDRTYDIREMGVKQVYTLMKEAVKRFDVLHYHFGTTLLPGGEDIRLARECGCRVYHSFWGIDQRAPECILYQQTRFLGYKPPRPFALTPEMVEWHEFLDQHCDAVYGYEGTKAGQLFYGLSDADEWTLEEKQRLAEGGLLEKDAKRLYILHAPSDQGKKGTELVLPVLLGMRDKGFPLEVLKVTGKPLAEAKQLYAYADIAFDQVGVGYWGLFSLECMLWEIPSMCWVQPKLHNMLGAPPVWGITAENLVHTVEVLHKLKQTGELAEHGRLAREWVLRKASIQAWRGWLEAEYVIPSAKRVNPLWEREAARLASGETSDFYKFLWDENVPLKWSKLYDRRRYA